MKFETTAERSRLMSKIRSTNTQPELLLRKELWKMGYRYRLNVASLKGKPDIVFNKYKIVVFVDGEFWHGHNWEQKKLKIKANPQYWVKKIERNMERDRENKTTLSALGYTVIRFWGGDILKDVAGCAARVVSVINAPALQ